MYAAVKLVAVCTSVAWFSHKSQRGRHANALFIPEVLVNTDSHRLLNPELKTKPISKGA